MYIMYQNSNSYETQTTFTINMRIQYQIQGISTIERRLRKSNCKSYQMKMINHGNGNSKGISHAVQLN